MKRKYQELEEGYRIIKRWGRWMFLEGFPWPKYEKFLTQEEKQNFNHCLRRRGIPVLESEHIYERDDGADT